MSDIHSQNGKESAVYVGTYTEPEQSTSEGIYVYGMDSSSGKLSLKSVVKDLINPAYLAIHPQTGYVYTVHEKEIFEGKRGGGVIALAIDSKNVEARLLNTQSSAGEDPCYISIERTGRYALVANYSSGSVAMLPIRPDGLIEILAIDQIPTNFLQPPVPTMRFNNDADVYMLNFNVQLPDRWTVHKEVWYDRQSLLPRLVPADQLTAAIAVDDIFFGLARVAGPASGGLLIAGIGLTGAYAVDVASFAFSLIAIWLLPSVPPAPPSCRRRRPRASSESCSRRV